MLRSFSYSLLITCFLLVTSCKTNFVATSSSSQNISVPDNSLTADSQIVRLYLSYRNILQKDMNRVISVSEKEMIKKRPESLLTNFLADLLLEEAKNEAKINHPEINPTISFFNYGGIRTFLPKGEITVGKIFELMPFENELVFLLLTGNQIHEFLNQISEKGGVSIGGARFVISNDNAREVTINGIMLNLSGEYWLATNDYIAEGGDGLDVLTHRLKIVKSNLKIRDIIIRNLENKQRNNELLTAKLDGRISYE